MPTSLRTCIRSLAIILLLPTSFLAAQKNKETIAAAPIPSQILAGKAVFISYGGINGDSVQRNTIAKFTGDPNDLYDEFYAAMKVWNRYQLVPAPSDADLVFEISVDCPRGDFPRMQLRIIDPRTHVVLWTFFEDAQMSLKNWKQAMDKVVNDARAISVQTPAGTNSSN